MWWEDIHIYGGIFSEIPWSTVWHSCRTRCTLYFLVHLVVWKCISHIPVDELAEPRWGHIQVFPMQLKYSTLVLVSMRKIQKCTSIFTFLSPHNGWNLKANSCRNWHLFFSVLGQVWRGSLTLWTSICPVRPSQREDKFEEATGHVELNSISGQTRSQTQKQQRIQSHFQTQTNCADKACSAGCLHVSCIISHAHRRSGLFHFYGV